MMRDINTIKVLVSFLSCKSICFSDGIYLLLNLNRVVRVLLTASRRDINLECKLVWSLKEVS